MITFDQARANVQRSLPPGRTTAPWGLEDDHSYFVITGTPGQLSGEDEPEMDVPTTFVDKSNGEITIDGPYLPRNRVGERINNMTHIGPWPADRL